MSTPNPTPRPREDQDPLLDNRPHRGPTEDDLIDNLPDGSDDAEGTPTEDTGDETQRNDRRSTEEGVEDRPRSSGSDREDVESP
jgi:hypothetical protein